MNINISLSVSSVLFINDITYYYLYSRKDSTTNSTTVPLCEKKRIIDYVYSVFQTKQEDSNYELHLALYSLSIFIAAIGDGQEVKYDDYEQVLPILEKNKIPLTYTIILMVVKNKYLQRCYYYFRQLIASNMLIRNFLFRLR